MAENEKPTPPSPPGSVSGDEGNPGPGNPRHESLSVNVRGVALGIGALLLMLLAVGGLMDQLFRLLTRGRERPAAATAPQLAERLPRSEPPLRADLSQELKDLQAEERDRLNSYGWVDRDAELVHIPIDRAMDLLLKQGLPVRKSKETPNR